MKRRTFLSLTSIAGMLGLPSWATATSTGTSDPGKSVEGLTNPPKPMVESAHHRQANISVIGVGGAGCYTVNHMIQGHVRGVWTFCLDTDPETVARSRSSIRYCMGHKRGPSLGAGGKPSIGRAHAIGDSFPIGALLMGAQTQMVFIVAGMGGGTGTGAAPVVAAVARKMGILTVAVVTMPFAFEGRRVTTAERGLSELASNVDSLIVVSNERLMDALGDQISVLDAFRAGDEVLKNTVSGIAELLNTPGVIHADFSDVRKMLGNMGRGMVGCGTASGRNRASIAAEKALISQSCQDIELSDARSVVVNITAGRQLGMWEVHDALRLIRQHVFPETIITFGTVHDDAMEDRLRVTLVAMRPRTT